MLEMCLWGLRTGKAFYFRVFPFIVCHQLNDCHPWNIFKLDRLSNKGRSWFCAKNKKTKSRDNLIVLRSSRDSQVGSGITWGTCSEGKKFQQDAVGGLRQAPDPHWLAAETAWRESQPWFTILEGDFKSSIKMHGGKMKITPPWTEWPNSGLSYFWYCLTFFSPLCFFTKVFSRFIHWT